MLTGALAVALKPRPRVHTPENLQSIALSWDGLDLTVWATDRRTAVTASTGHVAMASVLPVPKHPLVAAQDPVWFSRGEAEALLAWLPAWKSSKDRQVLVDLEMTAGRVTLAREGHPPLTLLTNSTPWLAVWLLFDRFTLTTRAQVPLSASVLKTLTALPRREDAMTMDFSKNVARFRWTSGIDTGETRWSYLAYAKAAPADCEQETHV